MSPLTLARAVSLGILAVATTAPAVAAAPPPRGVVLAPEEIPAAARVVLAQEIARARAADPAAFGALAAARQRLPDLDRNKRGRLVPVPALFRGLGGRALFPLVEELAFDAPARGDLPDPAWSAWCAGLIEALGRLREPRAAPLLSAILDGPAADPLVLAAAVEALAKLDTDEAADRLVALGDTAGPKQDAVWGGLGFCRRPRATRALARWLATGPESERAALLVRSLGIAGAAWAWRARSAGAPPSADETEVRRTSSQALVQAFARYDGPTRAAASDAILMVDHPSTAASIAGARRGATPAVRGELDVLARRFARNPLR